MNVMSAQSATLLLSRPDSAVASTTPAATPTIGPEVSVTLSPDAIASAAKAFEDNGPSSVDDARKLELVTARARAQAEMERLRELAQAEEAARTEESRVFNEWLAEEWGPYLEKAVNLLRHALGVPENKTIHLDGAAMAVVDQLAKENGLSFAPPPTSAAAQIVADWKRGAAESTGVIGVIGSTAGDPGFGKEMYIAFDRNAASSVLTLTGLSPGNGHPVLKNLLDRILRGREENGQGLPAGPAKWHALVDGASGTGRAAGVVLSLGLDDMARDKAAGMLTAVFDILRRAE